MAEVVGSLVGTLVAGQRVATDVAASRRKPQWVAPKTFKVNQNVMPFTLFAEKLGVKKEVGQAAYTHLENDDLPTTVTDSGSGALNSDTTINVASGHGKRVQAGRILKVLRTGEEIRVTAVATDALTVVRGVGGTTAYAILASEVIQILGHAASDGGSAASSVTSEPNIKTNYCQIFKSAVEVSGRDMESDVYGEDEWQRNWDDSMENHLGMIERTLLFQNGIASTEPNLTGGAEYWMSSNVTNNAGAVLTETGWNTFLRNWLRRNAGEDAALTCFVGEKANSAITGFGRDQLRYTPDDKVFGISCQAYRAETGQVIKLVRHPLMSPLGSDETAANKGWQGHVMAFNMRKVGRVNFRNRQKKVQKEIQTVGVDGMKQGLIDDLGFWMACEKQHAKIDGVGG